MKTGKTILLGLIAALAIGGSAFCVEPEQNEQAPIRERKIVKVYKAIENGVVSCYKAIENGVVTGYKAIEVKFIDTFLTPKIDMLDEKGEHN